MTKFTGKDDPGFVSVCGELGRWIRDGDAAKGHRGTPLLLNDSSPDKQSGTANQYGDNSRQYNAFGNATQKNVDGHYFEAKGNMTFGTIPSNNTKTQKAEQPPAGAA